MSTLQVDEKEEYKNLKTITESLETSLSISLAVAAM